MSTKRINELLENPKVLIGLGIFLVMFISISFMVSTIQNEIQKNIENNREYYCDDEEHILNSDDKTCIYEDRIHSSFICTDEDYEPVVGGCELKGTIEAIKETSGCSDGSNPYFENGLYWCENGKAYSNKTTYKCPENYTLVSSLHGAASVYVCKPNSYGNKKVWVLKDEVCPDGYENYKDYWCSKEKTYAAKYKNKK